jgi:hypothetical protein
MATPYDEAIDAHRNLAASIRTLMSVMERALDSVDDVLDLLHRGEPVAAILAKVQVHQVRRDVNAVLGNLERDRHQARLALIRAGLGQGLTITELGRLWGFSRQLAGRFAREARLSV